MSSTIFYFVTGALFLSSVMSCTKCISSPTVQQMYSASCGGANVAPPPPYQFNGDIGYTMFRKSVTFHMKPPIKDYLAEHGRAGLLRGLMDQRIAKEPPTQIQQGGQMFSTSYPLPYRGELRICDLFLHFWLRDQNIQLNAMQLSLDERDAVLDIVLMIVNQED